MRIDKQHKDRIYSPPPVLFELFKTILSESQEAGFYVAACCPHWDRSFPGISLFCSKDEGKTFERLDNIPKQATIGYVSAVTPNNIAVALEYGSLESFLKTDILNEKNLALIGDEVIGFTTAALISKPNCLLEYELTLFLRGQKKTDIVEHNIHERFVLLNNNIHFQKMSIEDMEKLTHLKCASAGVELANVTAMRICK